MSDERTQGPSEWDASALDALERSTSLSSAEVARAVGVDLALYLAWKAGERFATKRHAERLQRLRTPREVPNAPTTVTTTPRQQRLWALVERLQAEPQLLDQIEAWLAREHRASH